MQEEKNFQALDSLRLIEQMINTAKNRLADDGFYIIFWGWLVFAAALINYITWCFELMWGFLVWPVLMPLGAIVSFIAGRKRKKNEHVKTLVDSYLHYVWLSFGIGLGVALLFIGQNGMRSTYFFLMLLYGIATLSSGGLLAFKPLIYGSVVSFAMAIAAMFVPQRELLLCIAFALLFSYIVPGHLLKKQYRQENNV